MAAGLLLNMPRAKLFKPPNRDWGNLSQMAVLLKLP
jgi:hypothetical protein